MTRVETARLILREFAAADAEYLLELNSDPRVTRYTDIAGQTPDLLSIQTVEIPGYRATYSQSPGYGVFAAFEKDNSEFLGWFMLRPYRDALYFDSAYPFPDDIELGYRLKFSAWGQGLASEGVAALLSYGFGSLKVDAAMAVVLKENVSSVKVLEKNGLAKLSNNVDQIIYYRLEKS